MLKLVEIAPEGSKAKRDCKPKKGAAKETSPRLRLDHVITDSGVAASYAEAKIMGTADPGLSGQLGDQLCNSLWRPKDMSVDDLGVEIKAALQALEGISPRDEMEGMLAVQMIATHHAAMECFRRAMIPSQTFEGRESCLKHAEKLTRIYREQMEALQRYRHKAQPKPSPQEADAEAKGRKVLTPVA